MPETSTKTEAKPGEIKPITPETRELLMTYFASKPPEKPLSDKEFDSIRNYLDRQRGGLIKEVYELIKEDKELVKAASKSQIHKDHRKMDARAPEVRDTLLKALRMPIGEKSLSLEEFKKVAVFLDQKNGGLRRHAFALFKDDKEITDAARERRELMGAMKESAQNRSQGTEHPPLDQVKSQVLDQVRARTSRQSEAGAEIGK